MPRVLGIDPGTLSFDLCGLQDGSVFFERSAPSAEVAQRPELVLELLREAGPVELIAGPSGYGLPLTRLEDVGERELRLLCLADPGGAGGIGGLRALVRLLREARLPVVLTPGAIHLPSIPVHRKINRIDLGTADKVCAVAAAMLDQSERLRVAPVETAFVLVELGGAFSAVLSVEAGAIVSGQGGSSGPLGYRAAGAWDAELACLFRHIDKDSVFSGGAAFVAGAPDAEPEALAARSDPTAQLAIEALVEGVARAVASELAVAKRPREILLSGRLSHIARFRDAVTSALSRHAPVRAVQPPGTLKEAAYGAALIADGLAGGAHRDLVSAMRLREAAGTALDYLFLKGADALKRWAASGS